MLGQGERPGSGAIHALIVPADPAFASVRVGGLSVLLRAACALGRAADVVTVLRTPACGEALEAEVDRELRRRELRAAIEWKDAPGPIPEGASLVVLAGAAVLEPALVTALVARARSERVTLRCRRPGDARPVLWCAPPEGARELLERATQGAAVDVPGARDADPGGALLEFVTDDTARRRAEWEVVARSRKQSDSAMAKWFDRHISTALTRQLLDTDVTPNRITIGNTVMGVLGALLLLAGPYGLQLAGAFLLVLTVIFDGCDGEIARIKFLESSSGRRLDFFTDNVVNAIAIPAAGLGHYLRGGAPFFYYASIANFLLAVGSIAPVYYLFFRRHKAAVASDGSPERADLYKTAEGMSGRDFVYLIFGLALFGRIHWFTPVCLVGLSVFFVLVSALAVGRILESAGLVAPRGDLALSPCGTAAEPPVASPDDPGPAA